MLRSHLCGQVGDAGDVASGSRDAGHQSEPNRVNAGEEHNGDRRRCGFRHARGSVAGRRNHTDAPLNQIGRQGRQAIMSVLGPTIFQRHVLPDGMAAFRETALERGQTELVGLA
jgi:hypothetical protein